ncbi:MAG TPA: hypothetical protein VHP56_09765 [Solirubrobacterales bacterium]|jgi:hypothetical protein|nr:hypothetical protein [Solirubrobacterales bacterium]
MHDLVLSNFHIRRPKSLRRPSFAGNGLPERMRSTAFAFLGLTAALGLALVAIFAQLSFPVLAPAPPPAGPAGESGVSTSLAVGRGLAGPAQQAALLGGAAPAGVGGGGRNGVPSRRGDGRVGDVGSSVAAEKPGDAVEPNDEGVQQEPAPPPPAPAPTGSEAASAETAPAAAPTPIPTSPNPSPVTSTPKPKPNEEPPEPSEPEPTEPESKPGKHHGGKPQEEGPKPEEKPVKEPKPPKAEAPPAPAPVPPPAPEAPAEKGSSGKSRGKALGHYK